MVSNVPVYLQTMTVLKLKRHTIGTLAHPEIIKFNTVGTINSLATDVGTIEAV